MKCQVPVQAAVLAIMCAAASVSSADSQGDKDIRALFSAGAWDKALELLQNRPARDIASKELLGMAYLYTASRVDSVDNGKKAAETMKEVVDSGGTARFFVSKGQDKSREKHLLEATPGELAITSATVEFKPAPEFGLPTERWEKKDIAECGLNPKYGKSSNSFHLKLASKGEMHFRPLHFSADESNLICSLASAAPAATGTAK